MARRARVAAAHSQRYSSRCIARIVHLNDRRNVNEMEIESCECVCAFIFHGHRRATRRGERPWRGKLAVSNFHVIQSCAHNQQHTTKSAIICTFTCAAADMANKLIYRVKWMDVITNNTDTHFLTMNRSPRPRSSTLHAQAIGTRLCLPLIGFVANRRAHTANGSAQNLPLKKIMYIKYVNRECFMEIWQSCANNANIDSIP